MFEHTLEQVMRCKPDNINFLHITQGFSLRQERPKQTFPQYDLPPVNSNCTGRRYISLLQIEHLVFGFLLYFSGTHPVYHILYFSPLLLIHILHQ
jgi:hypothetical protein